jgi:hypothetical protein
MRFSAYLKSVAIFLSLLFVFLFIQAPVFAQATTSQAPVQTQSYLAPATNPNVPNNLHTFSQSLMLEIMSSLACNLAGKDPLSKNGQCLGYDSSTGKIGYVKTNGGALGAMTGMIAILYTPPLHTSDFIAYMGQNFGLAKPSYAQVQGIGFTGLTPLLHAWVVFRNVVYLLFVFIFILIGLAIMLRVRIDPRTVMTIQNQIPKIIISLILVTFSFAIAGFLIDLMWVSIYVIINLMAQADPKMAASAAGISTGIYHPAPQFANDLLAGGFPNLGGVHSLASNAAGSIKEIVQNFISPQTLPNPVSATASTGGGCSFGPFCVITNIVPNIDIGGLIGSVVSSVVGWVVGILAYLILIVALLWALLRLWFALLKAYIMILIDVIFAPFWIISGLIPGQQSAGFGAWLKDMAGNLAAFPAAIMMFLLAKLFSDNFISGAATGATGVNGNFTPGLSSTAFIPPLIGSDVSNYIASIIAIGVILATPGIVDLTKKAFKAPKLDLGPIGQSIGVGTGGMTKLVGGTIGVATDPYRQNDAKNAAGKSTGGAWLRSAFRSFR